ncbi:cytochrome B5 [Propioniciclava sp. MC1683]|nr:cytochrome B5 [Propioniciclava sp. MC1683]
MAELESNDGLEGRPAWVAVNGIVFDVSQAQGWEDGEHRGVKAGTDGTDLFVSSPHGFDTMSRTPVVGSLAG